MCICTCFWYKSKTDPNLSLSPSIINPDETQLRVAEYNVPKNAGFRWKDLESLFAKLANVVEIVNKEDTTDRCGFAFRLRLGSV